MENKTVTKKKEETKGKKFLKTAAKVGAGFLAFTGMLLGGYMLTPNREKILSIIVEEREKSPFEKFIEKTTKNVGLNEEPEENEEEPTKKYMHAAFDDLRIEYTMENSSKVNTVEIEGGLDFRMHDLAISGIELNLDADITYNSKEIPLKLGYFKETMYFQFKDLKLKCSHCDERSFMEAYAGIFAVNGYLDLNKLMNDAGSKLTTFLNDTVDGLIDGLSASNSEEPQPASAFKAVEVQTVTGWNFNINIDKEGTENDININLISDEDFNLQRVELGTINLGNVVISGNIDISLEDYDSFVSPAEADDSYVEIFNYTGIASKVASLLKEGNQKLGLSFTADLDDIAEATDLDIAYIEGSINVDFDKLLDLEQYTILPPSNPLKRDGGEKEETSIYDTIKDIGLNIQIDMFGQNDNEYANLDIAFADGEGYLRFNEQEDGEGNKSSVMKLNLDAETMNWIMSELPSMFEGLSGESNTKSLEKLSGFLSTDVTSAIEDGDFSFILDMLTKLENNSDGISLGIDLSTLGLGNHAEVELTINDNTELPSLDLAVSNLAFGDYELDLGMKTSEYQEVELGEKSEYQSVKFLPDVIEQVTDLVKEPKLGFEISGSVLKDSDQTGIRLQGAGKFEYTDENKAGFGEMTIYEDKYHANTAWATHKMYVDIENNPENIIENEDQYGNKTTDNQNEAYFIYGNPNGNNVKGKIHLQSVIDLVDVVKTFIGDAKNDPKFTKFIAPITKLMGMGALGEILNSKDYLKLASNELLQEVSIMEGGSGLKVVVGGSMLGLPGDLTLKINFEGNDAEGNQKIKSIQIVDFKMGEGEAVKTINMTITLKDYDFALTNQVEAHRSENFMNLDGIKTLLSLGINTTKANYYELSADINVNVNVLAIDIPVTLNGVKFYVYVDGVHVKVFGKIGHVPLVPVASEDYDLLELDQEMKAEFSFETFDDSEKEDGDDVGGIFNIKRQIVNPESEWSWSKFGLVDYNEIKNYYYRSNSSNFLDHIVEYLLGGLVGIKGKYVDAILGSDSSSSDEPAARDFTQSFTSTGFKASTSGTGMNTVEKIQLGLNLDILTGVDALKEAEITITSKRVGYHYDEYNQMIDTIDVLGGLSANMRIHYAVDINISFSATVDDVAFDQAKSLVKWNANANSDFNALTTIVIPEAYINAPTNPYVVNQKIYL